MQRVVQPEGLKPAHAEPGTPRCLPQALEPEEVLAWPVKAVAVVILAEARGPPWERMMPVDSLVPVLDSPEVVAVDVVAEAVLSLGAPPEALLQPPVAHSPQEVRPRG